MQIRQLWVVLPYARILKLRVILRRRLGTEEHVWRAPLGGHILNHLETQSSPYLFFNFPCSIDIEKGANQSFMTFLHVRYSRLKGNFLVS